MAKYASEDYRSRARSQRQDKLEGNRFKLEQGINVFRILKTPEDKARHSPDVWIEYRMHSDVGPKARFVRCGKSMSGKGRCWLCDVKIPKLQAKGRSSEAAAMEAKPQLGIQVARVDKDTGKMRGPKLYSMNNGGPKSMAYKLQGIIQADKDYLSHKKGYNLTVERVGKGKTDTTYSDPRPDDEPSKVPKSILEKLKPFVDVIPTYDEEYMKAAYYGTEEDSSMAKGKKKRHDED